jgi:octaprenyl-diphosphate synthase
VREKLIAAKERGTPEHHNLVRRAIETGGLGELDHIIVIVKSTGALEVTRARSQLELAAQLLARRT